MGTENRESCSQRDSSECKEYVKVHWLFNRIWKEKDSAELDILSKVLNRDYKRVKANKGVSDTDGYLEAVETAADKEEKTAGSEVTRVGSL